MDNGKLRYIAVITVIVIALIIGFCVIAIASYLLLVVASGG